MSGEGWVSLCLCERGGIVDSRIGCEEGASGTLDIMICAGPDDTPSPFTLPVPSLFQDSSPSSLSVSRRPLACETW